MTTTLESLISRPTRGTISTMFIFFTVMASVVAFMGFGVYGSLADEEWVFWPMAGILASWGLAALWMWYQEDKHGKPEPYNRI